MLSLVELTNPKFVILENVPGLLNLQLKLGADSVIYSGMFKLLIAIFLSLGYAHYSIQYFIY